MNIKCIVVATGASGSPEFFGCEVKATQKEYDLGDHYGRAKLMALKAGYEAPMIVFDDKEAPAWLIKNVF